MKNIVVDPNGRWREYDYMEPNFRLGAKRIPVDICHAVEVLKVNAETGQEEWTFVSSTVVSQFVIENSRLINPETYEFVNAGMPGLPAYNAMIAKFAEAYTIVANALETCAEVNYLLPGQVRPDTVRREEIVEGEGEGETV